MTRIAYFPYQPEDLIVRARRPRIVSNWKLTKFLSVTLAHITKRHRNCFSYILARILLCPFFLIFRDRAKARRAALRPHPICEQFFMNRPPAGLKKLQSASKKLHIIILINIHLYKVSLLPEHLCKKITKITKKN